MLSMFSLFTPILLLVSRSELTLQNPPELIWGVLKINQCSKYAR